MMFVLTKASDATPHEVEIPTLEALIALLRSCGHPLILEVVTAHEARWRESGRSASGHTGIDRLELMVYDDNIE